jgi:hypothetical protein
MSSGTFTAFRPQTSLFDDDVKGGGELSQSLPKDEAKSAAVKKKVRKVPKAGAGHALVSQQGAGAAGTGQGKAEQSDAGTGGAFVLRQAQDEGHKAEQVRARQVGTKLGSAGANPSPQNPHPELVEGRGFHQHKGAQSEQSFAVMLEPVKLSTNNSLEPQPSSDVVVYEPPSTELVVVQNHAVVAVVAVDEPAVQPLPETVSDHEQDSHSIAAHHPLLLDIIPIRGLDSQRGADILEVETGSPASSIPHQSVSRPKVTSSDLRKRRRRRGVMFEELMGWILVPLILIGIYWGLESVLKMFGLSIDGALQIIKGFRQ